MVGLWLPWLWDERSGAGGVWGTRGPPGALQVIQGSGKVEELEKLLPPAREQWPRGMQPGGWSWAPSHLSQGQQTMALWHPRQSCSWDCGQTQPGRGP